MEQGRVLPEPTELTRPYWEAFRSGELRLQYCGACRRFIHFPEPECPACGSGELGWKPVSGRGVVHTFSVVHRTFAPGFYDRVPYVVAWVELEEQTGLRLFGNVLYTHPDDVRIGLPVEAVAEHLEGFGPVPNFRASHGAPREENQTWQTA
ncbi:OB-fold domain-containing protein [Streptomyces sp. NPDC046909]|uniref:Zn-ribbon domain-containing OB-fold protein n=1 Tax=Streptomyces sp. NPDC046909 TaxID=3155617 RepID=UPI0033EF393D